MSTKLWIETLTNDEIVRNQNNLGEDIELSEEFLFKVILNEELLKQYLSSEEINEIRPNWGEIQLKPTDTLKGINRQKYLELLNEVMRTNSKKNLDDFLYSMGITSDKLVDRAKSPEKVLTIIKKLLPNLKNAMEYRKFKNEFKTLTSFLQRRIVNSEKILIEFRD